MAFEFEALVGHLYVVGGRAISASPPGALVEIAPKRAVRGRELETFFAFVLPSGDVTAPTAFYEQMSKVAAERYFNTTGSVTSTLRSILNHLNENLAEHNHISKRHYEANMLCGVLRENDLIIARVGAGVVIARMQGEIKTYPENLSDDDALFGPPLGVQPIPDVKMTRYTVTNGSRLLLADVNLADVPLDKLGEKLQADDIAAVLIGLKELALKQVTLMAVEFVPPDVPAPLPVKEGRSTAEIAAPKIATAELVRATTETALATSNSRRDRRSPLDETAQKIGVQLQQGAGVAALQTSRAMSSLDKALERILPESKDDQKKRWSSPLVTLVVLLLPIVVVAVVVLLWLGGVGPSQFEGCVNEATSRAQLARTIPSNNRTDTITAWNLVLAQVENCDQIRPNDVYLDTLRTQGQSAIDGLNQITRREAKPIATVQGEGVIISQMILQGTDIYALDDTNSMAYRISLSADGTEAAGVPQPIQAMREGGTVGQYTVDRLVGIAYSNEDKLIVGVDRSGLLVSCQPRFITQCEAQRLVAAAEFWRSPIAIAVWTNKLYILDPGADQIWRYEQTAGTYNAAPTEYFKAASRPPLINAVDFGIDSLGNLYLLHSDGVVTKYFGSEAADYGYGGFPQTPTGGTALFIDNSQYPGVAIVNRADRTIYETGQAGTWRTSFRVFDEDLFALLSDVAVAPGQRIIYAASGNAILMLQRD